jgi:hypothetical protein
MRRRKTSGDAAKTQRPKTLKRRSAPKAARHSSSLPAGKETNVEQLIRELAEAREREAATAEVLKIISSSPGELEPVFDAMLEKAMHVCEATFGHLATYDGARFLTVAIRGVPAPFAEFRRHNPPVYGPGTGVARLLAGERVVHFVDAADTDVYRHGDPNQRAVVDLGGARTMLVVPLLKDEALRGFITLYRQEVRPFAHGRLPPFRCSKAKD